MNRDLEKRVQRVSAAVERLRKVRGFDDEGGLTVENRMLVVSLAWFLGRLHEREALSAGYARSLGYATALDLFEALTHDGPGVTARHEAAVRELFKRAKVDIDVADDETAMRVLRNMAAAVPESVRGSILVLRRFVTPTHEADHDRTIN
jgi:hypothetical protein